MIKKLQLVVLGVVVLQGVSLSASEKSSNSPRTVTHSPKSLKSSLSCSQEMLKSSLGVRKEEKKNKSCGCGSRFIADQSLAERLKNDPRIIWLPI